MREHMIRLEARRDHANNKFYIMLSENLPYGLYEIVIPQDEPLRITKAIFNPPATIVLWNDGTKTVVKCSNEESYDPEKGLAMAIVKKTFGNHGNYYNIFKAVLPKPADIPTPKKVEDLNLNLDFSAFVDIFQETLSEMLSLKQKGEISK